MQDVFLEDDVKASVKRTLDLLRHVSVDSSLAFAERLVVCTRLQTAFKFKPNHVLDRSVYEIIMTHAVAAEKLGPGGFKRTIDLLTKKEVPSVERVIHSRLPSQKGIEKLVHECCKNPLISKIIVDAVELAGFTGRVIVEKTSSSTPSVELVRGYTFALRSMLDIDITLSNPRIVCIDGYLEEVSEVHHILQAASDSKESCLMFVRGASDDVKHTLRVNYDRGSLRVIPLLAPFDLGGMNTLVDVAVVSGADLVSSLKGDLISSVRLTDAPIVESVSVYKGQVIITNTKTHATVATHVANIKKRRSDEDIDDKGKLLDKRIRSLSPNHVIVRLPNDKDFVVRSQIIDTTLRTLRSAIEHGLNPDGTLTSVETASRYHAKACQSALNDLGAFVKLPSEPSTS